MKKIVAFLFIIVFIAPHILHAQSTSLVTTATISATSTNASYPLVNIKDGNELTKWQSALNSTQSISITLVNSIRFMSIKLKKVYAPYGFKIKLSSDNSTWTEVATYSVSVDLFTKSNLYLFASNEFKAFKYIKLELDGFTGYAAVGEIEITEDPTLFSSIAASSNISNPIYAVDGNTATTTGTYNSGPYNFKVSFSKILQAAEVVITSLTPGFTVDLYRGSNCLQIGYYYTLGGIDRFLIVNPDGFDGIYLSVNSLAQGGITGISVTQKSLSGTSLLYSYDNGGNTINRTIVMASSLASKIEENDTIIPLEPGIKPFEDKFLTETIRIFPSPTKGIINIVAENIDSEKAMKIELININGISILNEQFKSGKATVDISNQPTGTYYININVDNESHQWTIIKQ